jgi:hypothetical protein
LRQTNLESARLGGQGDWRSSDSHIGRLWKLGGAQPAAKPFMLRVPAKRRVELVLRRAPHRPERRGCLTLDPRPEDIEIGLAPCYSLSGLLRAREVVITFEPGKPSDG